MQATAFKFEEAVHSRNHVSLKGMQDI